MVYHYTSFKSFKKIIARSRLLMRCSLELNDSRENDDLIVDLIYALLFDTSIDDCQKTNICRLLFKDFVRDNFFRNELSACDIFDSAIPHFYTLSLTTECDRAIQWLSYGDNGKGIAIGFDESFFIEVKTAIIDDNQIYDINYKNVVYTKSDEYEKLLNSLIDYIKNNYFTEEPNEYSYCNVIEKILDCCNFVKSDEFSFEKEKRLSIRNYPDNLPKKTNRLTYRTI